ncbi:PDR/VanB family oxidoreductase [Pseudorhodoferax sp.]|uniref:PDR/VanB family oxidoreductase n=1 Tax=Pseudorhodoferax sp. TaxID=1993553 RepID=UPI002DD61948|nr:PDR/VanB family oxidoreductase [Pseudorhodoferax sp.]
MQLLVARLTQEAQDVLGLELRAPDGGTLPAFTAGAHVDVRLPGGICRQYSLANSPLDRDRYVLGVGLAPASRGGSAYLHQGLAAGDTLEVGAPRALFGIAPEATEHVFVAGGIGVTPILSMVHWCQAQGRPWRLLYCVRTRARAAYAWTLARHGERVRLHVDQEADGAPPDLAAWLRDAPAGAHVYCCGPEGLMGAVGAAAAECGLPKAATHFERFAPPEAVACAVPAGGFQVVLRRSGKSLHVRPDQSLLDALEEASVGVPFSCREGMCRSCEVPLLAGQADHRDFVLSDAERDAHTCILPCVSRARSAELVLDL